MNQINELHEEAMDLADEGDRAKKRGDYAAAQTLYRRALELETHAADETPIGTEPTRSILYRSAAWLAIYCHLESEAEKLALKGLESAPSGIAAELREVLNRVRPFELPENDLEIAKRYFDSGNAKLRDRDYQLAIEDYNEALRIDTQNTKIYDNRGIARSQLGDLDGAIADYEEAIRLNPQNANAYYNRGIARSQLGDPDEAIADYEEAIRLNPQNANAFYNRGIARSQIGDFDGAIADYEEAIRLNPEYANDEYNYTTALRRKRIRSEERFNNNQ
jgi:tetratricopeptide (TPR) repeat protein